MHTYVCMQVSSSMNKVSWCEHYYHEETLLPEKLILCVFLGYTTYTVYTNLTSSMKTTTKCIERDSVNFSTVFHVVLRKRNGDGRRIEVRESKWVQLVKIDINASTQ